MDFQFGDRREAMQAASAHVARQGKRDVSLIVPISSSTMLTLELRGWGVLCLPLSYFRVAKTYVGFSILHAAAPCTFSDLDCTHSLDIFPYLPLVFEQAPRSTWPAESSQQLQNDVTQGSAML
jgi:hypothetical protein